VSNNGPKGGPVWDLELIFEGLDLPWTLSQPLVNDEPLTLGGNSSVARQIDFILVWKVEDTLQIFEKLLGPRTLLNASVEYRRSRKWGRGQFKSNQLTVDSVALCDDLRRSYREQHRSLSVLAARTRIDKLLRQAASALNLSLDDGTQFANGAWTAIAQPGEPLDYVINGQDGHLHLEFRCGGTGWVTADGTHDTLERIAAVHQDAVESARSEVSKVEAHLTSAGPASQGPEVGPPQSPAPTEHF
jgi:hypothetical protein